MNLAFLAYLIAKGIRRTASREFSGLRSSKPVSRSYAGQLRGPAVLADEGHRVVDVRTTSRHVRFNPHEIIELAFVSSLPCSSSRKKKPEDDRRTSTTKVIGAKRSFTDVARVGPRDDAVEQAAAVPNASRAVQLGTPRTLCCIRCILA